MSRLVAEDALVGRWGVRVASGMLILNVLIGALAVLSDDGSSSGAAVGATAAAAPTTTAAPATPSTAAASDVDPAHARLTARNEFTKPVTINVGSVDEGSWSLKPGQSSDPLVLTTAPDHSEGVSIVDSAGCGSSSGAALFVGGHEYELIAVARTGQCTAGSAGPQLLIRDLTTGATTTV